MKIDIFDTTLRDGFQQEGISPSVKDKLAIAKLLDDLGVDYIEGGWPGASPKEEEFFDKAKKGLKLTNAKLVSFGSTRKLNIKVEDDPQVKALVDAGTEYVCIVGKSSNLHITKAIETDVDEAIKMATDTIEYLKSNGKKVFFDAEHFFDGYKENSEVSYKILDAVINEGVDCFIFCDTNGGTLPHEVRSIFEEVKKFISVRIGIHAHNDSEVAVANSLTAVQTGAEQVQGTINGIGERCGNANLVSIISNLKIKMGINCMTDEQLESLKDVSAFVDELANRAHWNQQPFVGRSAFAHKGGVHVSAVRKNALTYEHIAPERVGNHQRILVSDLSGKSNVLHKAKEYGIDIDDKDPKVAKILSSLKESENLGFQYEGAEASFELMMRDALGQKKIFFEFIGFRVIVEKRQEDEEPISEATVKIRVNGVQEVSAAEGTGPINALDKAIKKSLVKFYPELERVNLYDYKVRILDEKKGTRAKTRVLVESGDNHSKWGTVGVSENIIEASWQALIDSIDYKLNQKR